MGRAVVGGEVVRGESGGEDMGRGGSGGLSSGERREWWGGHGEEEVSKCGFLLQTNK